MTESSCRACGSANQSVALRYDGFAIWRCSDCGFGQVDRQPSDAQLREIYSATYFAKQNFSRMAATRHEYARRREWMVQAGIQPGARILEVGCATGGFLETLEASYDAWGIDFSAAAIDRARIAMPQRAAQLIAGDIDALPSGEAFDAILCWDTIEHVWDPADLIAKSTARLRAGGVLVLSTPNFGAPIARLMKRRWAFMTPPEHLGFFTREALERASRKAGLVPILWRTVGKAVAPAFLAYKMRRVFPAMVPRGLPDWLAARLPADWFVYVPTGDIQYLAARKVGTQA